MCNQIDARTRRARKEHRCWACHEITKQVFDYIEVAGSYWGDPDAGSQPEDYAEWATDTDYPDTPEKQAYRVRAGLTRGAEMAL